MRRVTLLDLAITQFPTETRKSLYARIACGEISSERGRHRDPKERVPDSLTLVISADRYVSRAGYKLEAAIEAWDVPVAGNTWLDAGASTGGFTDCLLQHGARTVHAVDVGYNQLSYSLRVDKRVVVHERTNAREIGPLDPPPAAAVADLSFRSLRGIVSTILAVTTEGWGIVLFKPQFELAYEIEHGRAAQSDGVVRDLELADELLENVVGHLRSENVTVHRTIASPLPGRSGNREQLLLVSLTEVLPYALNVSRDSGAPM